LLEFDKESIQFEEGTNLASPLG